MLKRKLSFIQAAALITGVLIILIALSIPATVRADTPIPDPDNGNCISCHEDLYFLHDTGNWFCLKESPMACVDCHGGDPSTLTKEAAHTNRAPHPVVNSDVSKCQECHPDQCYERVDLFNKTAGISEIKVAVPYVPAYSTPITENAPTTRPQTTQVLIGLALISSLVLAVYFGIRGRYSKKGNQ